MLNETARERLSLARRSSFIIRLSALLLPCAVLATGSSPAHAQQYPAKPVRVIVPYAAGGPVDEVARLLAPRLAETWGHTLVVDNRVGAGGSIGTEAGARAAPDGYTLLLGNSGPFAVNPALQKVSYDPLKDFVPVTMLLAGQMALSVHPSLPARSVKELTALARANPGRVNSGFIGVGNLTHLGFGLLQSRAGIKLNLIPYKGAGPALVDLMAGHIEVLYANISGTVPLARTGRVRVIAVSSAKRSPALADVPTVAETYPGYDFITWMGIFVPPATAPQVVAKLHGDFVKVMQRPDIRSRLESQGNEVIASGGEQLGARMREEIALYGKLIRSLGIKVE